MPVRPADDRKLRELILYILQRSQDDPHMGATKLNKVLFRCDFGAFAQLGDPITGHPYFKLENGPAPRHLVEIRKGLVADRSVQLRKVDMGADKPMDRWIPLRQPDLSYFTGEQLGFIDGVVQEMREQTGTDAAERSHLMVGWRIAELHQEIPYETALIANRATAADVERGRFLAREHGW